MTRPTLTVRSVLDLIALAPQVIGFQPRDSVVMLTFGPGGGGFHARVDLPRQRPDQCEVTRLLVRAAVRNHAEAAAVLVFSDDVTATLHQLELLVGELLGAGLAVLEAARVEADRFYLPLEGDRVGTPYDLRSHPITAQCVFVGLVAHESREALAASLVDADEPARAGTAQAVVRLAESRPALTDLVREGAWLAARARRFVADGLPLTDPDAARFLLDLNVPELLDGLFEQVDRDDASHWVDLLRDLVRRAPTQQLASAAGLLAFAAWLAGDGALAWCAIDRCTAVDPAHGLARSVAGLLSDAVPPTLWGTLRGGPRPPSRRPTR